MENKQQLPNSVAVLVLGICSIVFSCFFIGVILGIIGLVLSGTGRTAYKKDPQKYDGFSMLNAGFIMSIIGVCLSGLYALYYIFIVLILGGTFLSLLHSVQQ